MGSYAPTVGMIMVSGGSIIILGGLLYANRSCGNKELFSLG